MTKKKTFYFESNNGGALHQSAHRNRGFEERHSLLQLLHTAEHPITPAETAPTRSAPERDRTEETGILIR